MRQSRILLYLLGSIMACMPEAARAQWVTGTGTVTYTGGNVGIGTTTPRSTGYATTGWLDVNAGIFIGNGANIGNSNYSSQTTPPNGGLIGWNKTGFEGEIDFVNLSGTGPDGGFAFYDRDNPLVRILKNGYVGIGTLYPPYPLQISSYSFGSPSLTYHSTTAMFGLDVPGNAELAAGWLGATPYGYWLQARSASSAAEPLSLNPLGGYVGIGTTNPNYPLSVNGVIQAKEIIVNTGWSDYVFDPGYRLEPLSEVAAYVEANHHLPGIPAADEVAAKGIGVGEIQSKLLAKIEELTLHMIEADRENRALRERVQKLESGQQK